VYDVASGVLAALGTGYLPAVCLSTGGAPPGYSDTQASPALNQVRWYLVRARNSCGTGNYGTGSNGVLRVIDACP